LPRCATREASLDGSRLGILLLLLWVWAPVAGAVQPDGVVRDLVELRALEAEAVRAGVPVELEGTLTFVNTAEFATYGFMQEGQDAIYLRLDEGLSAPPAGHRVRLRATTQPGEFAPSLDVHRIRDLGPAPPLEPAIDLSEDFVATQFDARWVSADGVVRRLDLDPGSHLHVLWLGSDENALTVELPGDLPVERVRRLVGARVEARGAAGARFNTQRQLIRPRVLVPDLEHVRVLEAPLAHPERLPVQPLSHLLRYGAPAGPGGLVRVQGVVTFHSPSLLVVQDDSAAVSVRLARGSAPQPGSRVRLTGYPEAQALAPTLTDARILDVTPGALPAPVPIENPLDAAYGFRRVQVEGQVLRRSVRGERAVLMLVVGERLVEGVVGDGESLPARVRPGATIRVTGVVHQRVDPLQPRRISSVRYAQVANDAQLLVDSGSDVVVLASAPWWTATRVVLLIAALGLVLGLAVVVVLVLRHQVRRQTGQIREQLAVQAQLRREAQAASVAKGRFLATMSHELRTPLHGILGTLSILRDSQGLSDPDRELVELVHDSGTQLSRLVGDILDLSKAEAGQLQIAREPVEVRSLLQACVHEVRDLAASKGLRVQLDVGEDVPDWVDSDPLRLRQVVSNLLTNAVKFTDKGGVRVSATAAGGRLTVRVIDTGPGIAEEDQPALFRPFHQIDSRVVRVHGGTGLGLAICREICELLGGDISVVSDVGAGAAFAVRLPAPPVDPPVQDQVQAPYVDLAGLRVLVADDNAVNRTIVQGMLARLSVQPVVVEDGAQAVEAAKREPFDVVLLDLHMPVMGGLEAAHVLRRDLGEACPPVLALTADALAKTRKACLHAGMSGVLTKPITLDELRGVLGKVGPGEAPRRAAR